jgi:hypothetical protein
MNTIRSLMNIHGNRVAHIDDEREMGNNIIVTLHAGWFFKDEPDCGVRGFDTLKELKEGVKSANMIFSPRKSFKNEAPYNAEFLGAQPARAGEDY